MSDDFYDISAKMKKLFPSNPAADLAALQEMAGAPVKEDIKVDQINESASVKKGSLPIDLDLQSFAKLAGLNESQKTGSAGQLKGKDSIAKQPAMTTKNPTRDKLVGDSMDLDELDISDLKNTKPVPMPNMGGKSKIDELEKRMEQNFRYFKARIEKIEQQLNVSEGNSPHKKGSTKYKKHMAAMHAGESTKDSIKEELLAKLKASK